MWAYVGAAIIAGGACAVLYILRSLSPTGAVPSNHYPSKPERLVSKATSLPPEASAEAPFDDPQADLILQSSDGVHFRVFKLILSFASPVIVDMLSIPSPLSQKPHDEDQVAHLTEHSTALDVVLRHIYPVRLPNGDTLLYANILAEFARKYKVESLDRFITGYLTDSVERDPVGVYAIAVSYGHNDIGAIAARSCLNLPFSGLESPYLRCITAEHLSELHRYHVACGKAASAVAASDRTWFLSFDQKVALRRDVLGIACQSCSVPDVLDLTSTLRHGPNYNSEGGWLLPTKKESGRTRSGAGANTAAVTNTGAAADPVAVAAADTGAIADTGTGTDMGTGTTTGKGKSTSMNTIRSGSSAATASASTWTGRTSPRCMWNYLHRSALVLAHHPSAEAVTTEAFVLRSNGCNSCTQHMRGHVLELSVALGGEIKRAVERVSLSSRCPCLRCSMMHPHMWQVPLPKAVSVEVPLTPIYTDRGCICQNGFQ